MKSAQYRDKITMFKMDSFNTTLKQVSKNSIY